MLLENAFLLAKYEIEIYYCTYIYKLIKAYNKKFEPKTESKQPMLKLHIVSIKVKHFSKKVHQSLKIG